MKITFSIPISRYSFSHNDCGLRWYLHFKAFIFDS